MPLADGPGHRAPALGAGCPQDAERVAVCARRVRATVRARIRTKGSATQTPKSRECMNPLVTTLAPMDAYRLLARDYDRNPNPMLVLEQRTMTPLFPSLRGACVVDAAAG